MPVQISTVYESLVDVQTGSDGRFTGELTLNQEDDIYAQFIPDNDHASAESQLQHISVQPSPTRFTIKVTPAQVKLGEPVTVSGRLT